MLTVDGRILELVRKRFAAARAEAMQELEYGQPHVVSDYAEYVRRVGFLSGLALLDTAIEEAQTQAQQEAGQPPKSA